MKTTLLICVETVLCAPMRARAQRATAGAALAIVLLLLSAPDGSVAGAGAAHRGVRASAAKRHTTKKKHRAKKHRAKKQHKVQGPGVALFNREAYPYTSPVSLATEAKRYSVIVLQGPDGKLVKSLHAANHKLKVLVYQDPLLDNAGDPNLYTTCTSYQTAVASDPGWFLRDAAGRPIPARGYPGFYVMNVASPGYAQACVAHVIQQAKHWGFDGVYVDGLTAWAGWTFPAGITSPLYPTPVAWEGAMTSFISYMAPQVHAHGLMVIGNIGGSRIAPGLWQRWSSFLDGSEEESWTDAGQGPDEQILDWPTKLANVAWSEAHHKITLVHSYNPTAAGNEYGLASMMLVAGGWSSYSSGNNNYAAPEDWRGIFITAERLGPPTGRYTRQHNGAYVRRFAHGIVLVNPTAHPIGRFSLGGRYRGPSGGTVGSTGLGPTTGLILPSAG
jgi:hypothetical protein